MPEQTRAELEDLVRLIVESFRDASNPSVEIAVEEIMRTFEPFLPPEPELTDYDRLLGCIH